MSLCHQPTFFLAILNQILATFCMKNSDSFPWICTTGCRPDICSYLRLEWRFFFFIQSVTTVRLCACAVRRYMKYIILLLNFFRVQLSTLPPAALCRARQFDHTYLSTRDFFAKDNSTYMHCKRENFGCALGLIHIYLNIWYIYF